MKSSTLTIVLTACLAYLPGCGSDSDGSSSPSTDAGADSDGASGAAGQGGMAGSSGAAGTAGSSAAGAAGMSGGGGNGGSSGGGGAAGTAGAGPSCENGSECGTDVCDPASLTCSESTCDPSDHESCPAYPDTICMEQDNAQGACYQDCTPFDATGSCGPDAHCQVQSDDESRGICYKTGPNAAGETCVPTDTATDCVEGTVCVNFGSQSQPDRRCSTACQVFDDGPTGCPTGDLCMVPAICLPSSFGFFDDVPIGAECTEGDYLFCGYVAGRLTGTCDDGPSGGAELRCYAWCRLSEGSDDCDAGYTCTDTDWGNGLGVCVQQ